MNSKILLAFVGGAILASGIVYLAVKPDPGAKPVAVAATPAGPAGEPSAAASPDSAQPAVAESEPPRHERDEERPRRKAVKPSAAREHREEVARAIPPAAPVAPPEPVKQDPAPAPVQAPPAEPAPAPAYIPPPPPPPPQPHSVTVPAGTTLSVRIGETISTKKNQPGDTFMATLSQALVVDGFVLAERGARAEGKIVEAEKAGKVKGVSHLSVELTKLHLSDGQTLNMQTVPFIKEGDTSKKKDAAKVGLGAVLGAAIGAIAGGGKGAAIGTGVGGAAGAGDVMMTRGPDAQIPVETRLSFRTQEDVKVTERLH